MLLSPAESYHIAGNNIKYSVRETYLTVTLSLAQLVKFLGCKLHTHTPANSIFSSPAANLISILCFLGGWLGVKHQVTYLLVFFDKNPSTCYRKKENKKTSGCKILHFYWLFSSDMAVKGFNHSHSTDHSLIQLHADTVTLPFTQALSLSRAHAIIPLHVFGSSLIN